MAKHRLINGKKDLQVSVACELPSNVTLAAELSEVFNGFSISSNELTQLTLELDRDSSLGMQSYGRNHANNSDLYYSAKTVQNWYLR